METRYSDKIILNKRRKAVIITCLLLFIYQLIPVFLGFELCDSGFYMTFYEHIFDDPQCVEYNFMYYLTGLIGGSFLKLFPNSGLFEMRLLGLFCNMLIIYLLYHFYKNRIPIPATLLGVSLVIISYIKAPMTFYHDPQTCLLFVLAVITLFKGLENKSKACIFLSGFIIALNVFVRIPNLLDYSIITIILLYAIYHKRTFHECIGDCILFSIAFIVGIFSILLVLKWQGHYPYFINILNELVSIGNDNSGNNSHGILSMLSGYAKIYYLIVAFIAKLLLLYCIVFIPAFFTRRKSILYPAYFISLTGLIYIISRSELMTVLYAFSLIGTLGNILFSKNKSIKLLSYSGLIMMMIIPMGSDSLYNNGSIIFWLALPMSITFFYNIKTILAEHKIYHIPVRNLLIPTLVIYLTTCGIKLFNDGCYFDGGSLLSKNHAIDNEKAKHIYTSEDRAEIINELLTGIQPYITKGDYLFAYGSIPMINYLTQTKPFLRCSWPEQFSAQTLQRKLNEYEGKRPFILRQKFNSIGNESWKANEEYLLDCGKESGTLCTNEKNRIINQYIEKNNYKKVFENMYFVLYEPSSSQ